MRERERERVWVWERGSVGVSGKRGRGSVCVRDAGEFCECNSVCSGGCVGMCLCMCMWVGGMAVDPLPPDPHDQHVSEKRDCLLNFAKIQGPP